MFISVIEKFSNYSNVSQYLFSQINLQESYTITFVNIIFKCWFMLLKK